LATALITGVASLVSSFRTSMIEDEKKSSGDWHYSFENLNSEDIKFIENNRNVEKLFITENIGYSLLEESQNEYKPYLYIIGYSKDAFESLKVNLVEGRLPENENEIVISEHINGNGGVNYKVGDEIELEIGKRMCDGEELNQSNPYLKHDSKDLNDEIDEKHEEEIFVPKYNRKYKVVGIIKRLYYAQEPTSAPGYTVITFSDSNYEDNKVNVYTRYKDLRHNYEITAQILGVDEGAFKRVNSEYLENVSETDLSEVGKAKFAYSRNNTLIKWENLEFSDDSTKMLYSISAIIIGIIIVTSVFCIKNSFEISTTEKIKQYGMLSSIGATSKQIRKNVFYEGFILGLIGIPIGILSGILAIFVLIKIVNIILVDYLGNATFTFSINLLSIFVAIILSSITIYLSSKSSAKRASKISPIDAIRETNDLKIKGKKLKMPFWIKKMFGIGGVLAYKNLKRNGRKYRITIISIIVSVAIFIAMSFFVKYCFKTSEVVYENYKFNISLSGKDVLEYCEDISKNEEVKEYSIIRNALIEVNNKELQKHYVGKREKTYEENEGNTTVLNLISLGKEEYSRLLEECDLKYDECKDKGILYDTIEEYIMNDIQKGYSKYRLYDYKKGDYISGNIVKKGSSSGNETLLNIEIASVCDKYVPMGFESQCFADGAIIVSDEFLDKYSEYIHSDVEFYANAKDPNKLEEYINTEYPNKFFNVDNIYQMVQDNKSFYIVVAIFLYGFIVVISLIGITNIFNTITTNIELRQKEFANLKSIGMTKKEFNNMINLETIFYCTKSLIIGIPLGIGLSYLIYKAFELNTSFGFELPWNGILISICAVVLLIWCIMKFSVNKINKQNIIETIRKDNI